MWVRSLFWECPEDKGNAEVSVSLQINEFVNAVCVTVGDNRIFAVVNDHGRVGDTV